MSSRNELFEKIVLQRYKEFLCNLEATSAVHLDPVCSTSESPEIDKFERLGGFVLCKGERSIHGDVSIYLPELFSSEGLEMHDSLRSEICRLSNLVNLPLESVKFCSRAMYLSFVRTKYLKHFTDNESSRPSSDHKGKSLWVFYPDKLNSLQEFRNATIGEYALNLFNFQGFQVCRKSQETSPKLSPEFLSKIKSSVYYTDVEGAPTLDLPKFIESSSSRLPFMKGLSKNLHPIRVTPEVPHPALLYAQLIDEKIVQSSQQPAVCLHVIGHGEEHVTCLSLITWYALSCTESIEHMVLSVAAVDVTSSAPRDLSHHQQDRIEHILQSFSVKYGDGQNPWSSTDDTDADDWRRRACDLASAAFKLELLSVSCSSKVSLRPAEKSSLFKDALSVLYNFARLHTLFSKYDGLVKQGVYAQEPDHALLDFSVLKDESAWQIIFHHVSQFHATLSDSLPGTIRQLSRSRASGEEVLTQKSLFAKETNANKLTHLLLRLSRDVSHYYSKTHVLGEPYEHLQPVMFCRLAVLRAVMNVMQQSFTILKIKPPSWM